MAIKKFENKEEVGKSDFVGLFIALNNGDLNGLTEAVTKWNFKDEESFVKFAIAFMLKAENKKIYIDDSLGNKINILPNDELLKPLQK
jgi:hypothetical protein